LRVAFVKEDGAAEDLHDLGSRLLGQLVGDGEAIDWRLGPDAELDELVIEQRLRDLREDALGDPTLSDLDERIQPVSMRAQLAAQRPRRHQGPLARRHRFDPGRHDSGA